MIIVSKEYKGRLFSLLHFDIKFCPGYVRDLFDEVVFKKWILDFENAINQSFYDKKKWLMYSTLGTLFQHGRKERDFPLPVAILEYIETISDDECFEYLKNSYCIEAHNSVGIRTISDGADLLSKSNYYKTVSEDLKNKGYLKTACIFEQLSKEFYQTGNVERKRAEDEW